MSCNLRINSIHWEIIHWCIVVATLRCILGDIMIVAKTYRHRGKFMRFNFFQVNISSSFLFKKCQNLKLNNIELIDLSFGLAKYQLQILDTKTQNIFCCVNENSTSFLYTRKQKEPETKFLYFKGYNKVEMLLAKNIGF